MIIAMHQKDLRFGGEPLSKASRVLIMLHGRGAPAEDILGLASHLEVPDFALIAPQATQYTWYPYSFLAPPAQNEPWLTSAVAVVNEVVADVIKTGIDSEQIYFCGFSQGACLTLEYVTRNARRWGGVAAFTGGLIGDKIYPENYKGDFEGTPVFIGSADPDPHVPVARVRETTATLLDMHADVHEKIYPGMGHTIIDDEITLANQLIFNRQPRANR